MFDSRYDFLPNRMVLDKLPEEERHLLAAKSSELGFSFQEMKQLVDMAVDFHMWGSVRLSEIWPELDEHLSPKQKRTKCMEAIKTVWLEEKKRGADFSSFSESQNALGGKKIVSQTKKSLGLGMCPVASPKTRCCNLYTLDAIEGCGFDCSYCSIRTFYAPGEVRFDEGFTDKLKSLELDSNRRYHIGTGQASDSLMLGNHGGVLRALLDFARAHSNVILEFKTKSDNVSFLFDAEMPPNMVTTWSLNPKVIIEAEEHYTASLERRLVAAQKMAEKGNLVGFHLHPIIYCEDWQALYGDMIDQMLERFDPDRVCMVSMGALTFIKPVIKSLREEMRSSRILQVPLSDASGKQSYPLELREEIFSWVYERFKPWHDKVFFYLCMEDEELWKPVFGYEYASNDDFETAMLDAYFDKICCK